jgi:hypothetical protein
MLVAACCCKVLSCKQVLPSHCFVILPVTLLAIPVSSITPTAIVCICQVTLSCKQPLQAFAAAPAA